MSQVAAGPDIWMVLPDALFLCSGLAQPHELEALGVSALFDVALPPRPWPVREPDGFLYVLWPLRDAPYEPDAETLRAWARFGAALLLQRRVAVRCTAGVNRSALLAAAIVAERRQAGADAAIAQVRAARPEALSNGAFVALLRRLYPRTR